MFLHIQMTFYKVQPEHIEWHLAFITALGSWKAPICLMFGLCLPAYHQKGAAVQQLVSSPGSKPSCQIHLLHKVGRHPAISWVELRREKNEVRVDGISLPLFRFFGLFLERHLVPVIGFPVPSSGALPWSFMLSNLIGFFSSSV